MQVERDDSVGPCDLKQVGDQFRSDRLTGSCFTILPCVAEIRDDDGYFTGGSAFEGIKGDQDFHQGFRYRHAGRLDQENILPANGLFGFDDDFSVSEVFDRYLSARNA